MKIKKTMTPAAIEANRQNGKSGGPKTERGKNTVRKNAIKHGLSAKQLIFRDEAEKAEFEAFSDELERERRPQGIFQRMVTEGIAVTWWRLQVAEGWESAEIRTHRDASKSILRKLIEQSGDTEFPLFEKGIDNSAAAKLSFDCDELVVRSSHTNRENSKEDKLTMQEAHTGQLEFAARLTSSLDTVLRYKTGLKKDLYKQIQLLMELQASDSDGSG